LELLLVSKEEGGVGLGARPVRGAETLALAEGADGGGGVACLAEAEGEAGLLFEAVDVLCVYALETALVVETLEEAMEDGGLGLVCKTFELCDME
jgi:hypothetical protein